MLWERSEVQFSGKMFTLKVSELCLEQLLEFPLFLSAGQKLLGTLALCKKEAQNEMERRSRQLRCVGAAGQCVTVS